MFDSGVKENEDFGTLTVQSEGKIFPARETPVSDGRNSSFSQNKSKQIEAKTINSPSPVYETENELNSREINQLKQDVEILIITQNHLQSELNSKSITITEQAREI